MFTREGGWPVCVPAFAGTQALVWDTLTPRATTPAEAGAHWKGRRNGGLRFVSDAPQLGPGLRRGGRKVMQLLSDQNAAVALSSPIIAARTKGIGGPP